MESLINRLQEIAFINEVKIYKATIKNRWNCKIRYFIEDH